MRAELELLVKLLVCRRCSSVFSIETQALRACFCRKTAGLYVKDAIAVGWGPGLWIGFSNPSLTAALRAWATGENKNQEFTAFVIDETTCHTVFHLDHDPVGLVIGEDVTQLELEKLQNVVLAEQAKRVELARAAERTVTWHQHCFPRALSLTDSPDDELERYRFDAMEWNKSEYGVWDPRSKTTVVTGLPSRGVAESWALDLANKLHEQEKAK